MTQIVQPLDRRKWMLILATALLGATILANTSPGVNWGIWTFACAATVLISRRSSGLRSAKPALIFALGAIFTAFAAVATTEPAARACIVLLTAVLLACLLSTVDATELSAITATRLARSPFSAAGRIALAAPREISLAAKSATGIHSRVFLRRALLAAPVVAILALLLAGADPVFHAGIQNIEGWLPSDTITARIVFFVFLALLLLGSCSTLADLQLGSPLREYAPAPRRLPLADAIVVTASALGVLVVFLVLQLAYVFIALPGQAGSGITYADYARRGFGELCVVVSIVVAVILVTEKFRETSGDHSRQRILRVLQFALLAAAALILISAQRRIALYEDAYGYTTARVHASAFMIFMAGFLALLAVELRRSGISSSLGRRGAAIAMIIVLSILFWNDQAWIMNRNIDRARRDGKFDDRYALSLSLDALPTLLHRRAEISPATWAKLKTRLRCGLSREPRQWYSWNFAYSAAESAVEALDQKGEFVTCTPGSR
jgi:hypothetical protein